MEMTIEEYKNKLLDDIDFAITATGTSDAYCTGMVNGMKYVKSLIDGNKPEFIEVEEGEKGYNFPDVIGEACEMYVDGIWIKGKIVDGYRFRDGMVTIEDANGQRYSCGAARTELYRKGNMKEEKLRKLKAQLSTAGDRRDWDTCERIEKEIEELKGETNDRMY